MDCTLLKQRVFKTQSSMNKMAGRFSYYMVRKGITLDENMFGGISKVGVVVEQEEGHSLPNSFGPRVNRSITWEYDARQLLEDAGRTSSDRDDVRAMHNEDFPYNPRL